MGVLSGERWRPKRTHSSVHLTLDLEWPEGQVARLDAAEAACASSRQAALELGSQSQKVPMVHECWHQLTHKRLKETLLGQSEAVRSMNPKQQKMKITVAPHFSEQVPSDLGGGV